MNFSKYFETDEKNHCVYFRGNSLEITIPKRYENYGALEVGDVVTTLGMFDMLIDGNKETNCTLPARIVIVPSVVEPFTSEEGDAYIKLYLNDGDKFMKYLELVRDDKLAYMFFKEFISLGRLPKFIKYMDAPKIFNNARKFAGVNFNTNQVMFEIIFSHLYRSQDNIMQPYRLTDMKKDPMLVSMNDIQHSAMSVTGRIAGNYADAGMVSSIVNKSEHNSRVEDTLRQ